MRFWVVLVACFTVAAVLGGVPASSAAEVDVEPEEEAYHDFHYDSDGLYADVYDVKVDAEFEDWGYTVGLGEAGFVKARDNADRFLSEFLPADVADSKPVGPWDRKVWEESLTPPSVDPAELDRVLKMYGGMDNVTHWSVLDFGTDMGRKALIRAFADDVFNVDGDGNYVVILGEVSVWSITAAVFNYGNKAASKPVSTVDATVLNDAVVGMFGDAGITKANQAALETHFGDSGGEFTHEKVAEMVHSKTLTFEPSNDSTFEVTASTSGLGKAKVWPAFGSFGDDDADGVANSDDKESTVTYGDTFLTASAAQELPGQTQVLVDASGDGMADFEAGYGTVVDSRLVSYQTEAGVTVFKLINMDPLSRTYLEAYAQVSEGPGGAVSLFDDTGAVVKLTGAETKQANASGYDMNAVYNHRRLTDGGTTPGIDAIKEELAAAGITEESYTGQGSDVSSDWVEFVHDGTAYVTIRFREITEEVSDPSGFYFVKERTEHSFTINENSSKWKRFQTFKNDLDAFNGTITGDEGATATTGGALTAYGASQIAASAGLSYPYSLARLLPQAFLGAMTVYGGSKTYQATKAIKDMATIAHDLDAHTPLPDVPATTKADPGIIGTGYSAYWIPDDAELIADPNFVDADDADSPYGIDVMEYIYTRPGEPDSIYMVATNVADPDDEIYGLVVQAVKTTTIGDTETVTVYDSVGVETIIDEVDTGVTIVQPEPHDVHGIGEPDLEHLATELPDNAEITEEQAAGNIVYIVYTSDDFNGHKMLFAERTEKVDKPGHYHYRHSTVWITSEEGIRIRAAVEQYSEAADTIGLEESAVNATDWTFPKFSSYLPMAIALGYGGGGGGDGFTRPQATVSRMTAALAATAANLALEDVSINTALDFSSLFSNATENLESVWANRKPIHEIPTTQAPLTVAVALNPDAAAPATAPPETPSAATSASYFQQRAGESAVTNELSDNILANGLGLLPVGDAVNQELTALTAADRAASENTRGSINTSLLGDAEFNAAVTALANSVFGPIATQLGYPAGSTLQPDILNLRTWGQRGGATTFHQDRQGRDNNALVLAMTINDGTPMDYIPNDNFDDLQPDSTGYRFTLRRGVNEADVVAQVPNNNLVFFTTQNDNATPTGDNYHPLVRRSPAGSEGRSIVLFRFNATPPPK